MVPGAPNDLLSVSALVDQGYEFHFVNERSYVVTPAKEELELVRKSGLYWLKWAKAIDSEVSVDNLKGIRRAGRLQPQGNLGKSTLLSQKDESSSELNSAEGLGIGCRSDLAADSSTKAFAVSPCDSAECQFCNAASGSARVPMSLLHRRCIHWNQEKLVKMSKCGAIDLAPTDAQPCVCEVCKAAKATRNAVPRTRESFPETVKPFSRVWTDVKGKVDADFWGNRYVITFSCEVTRWVYVAFCQYKSQAKDRFKEFLDWVQKMGYKCNLLNSDGGGEYTSNENAKVLSEFQKICVDNNIEQNFTSAHTPAQNGIAERVNRTLVEHARCLLIDAGLSRKFWSLAVKHVAYCRNRFWHQKHHVSANVGSSAFQHLHGKAPKLGNLRVWGCDAWKLDHDHRSGSFARKAHKLIFVGISANRKGWVLFDPRTRKLSTSYHCSFNESMDNRVCALRDFDLRPAKARPGASQDEERHALLEREVYDMSADLMFDSEVSDLPAQQHESSEQQKDDVDPSSGSVGDNSVMFPNARLSQPGVPRLEVLKN